MLSFVYRCSLKPDMYIYLAEEDVFDNVPREIFNSLGIVEFSMELDIQADTKLAREDELDIQADTKLAREDTGTVVDNLKEFGFHLQLAGHESVEAIMARIAAGKK